MNSKNIFSVIIFFSVAVQALALPTNPPGHQYYVVVGGFADQKNAVQFAKVSIAEVSPA